MNYNIYKFIHLLMMGLCLMTSLSCSGLSSLGGQSIEQTFSNKSVVVLVKAANSGDVEKIDYLVKQGINVNTIGNNGATPLIWTLNARNHRGVEALLQAGADPNLAPDKTHFSAMNFVPLGDDPELLRLLLKYGGDPNHLGAGRITDRPLSLAASEGRIENMKLLLDAGADINAHDKFNESAASNSITLAKFEATVFLLEHGFNFNLSRLERMVKSRQIPDNSPSKQWKEKALRMLKEKIASDSSHRAYE